MDTENERNGKVVDKQKKSIEFPADIEYPALKEIGTGAFYNYE